MTGARAVGERGLGGVRVLDSCRLEKRMELTSFGELSWTRPDETPLSAKTVARSPKNATYIAKKKQKKKTYFQISVWPSLSFTPTKVSTILF